MEIENLFIWKKQETRWEKFKAWLYEEMSPFWSNWMNLRQGFQYAVWATFGIGYMNSLVFNFVYGEWVVAGVRITMMMWFAMWCIEVYYSQKTRKRMQNIFDGWTETINQWRETARTVETLERENAKLREELKQRRI